MNIYRLLLLIVIFLVTDQAFANGELNVTYTRYVNPLLKTNTVKQSFLGAIYPFGRIQAVPIINHGVKASNGRIMGFSHKFQRSKKESDLGELVLMPFSEGNAHEQTASSFDRASEKAQAGLYQVTLKDHQIDVSLSAVEQVVFHQYTFNKGGDNKLYLDLQNRAATSAYPKLGAVWLEDDYTLSGEINPAPSSNNKVFFVLKFNQPVKTARSLEANSGGLASNMVVNFGDIPSQQLLVKVALSDQSIVNAKHQLTTETPHWHFDVVYMQANQQWHRYLSRVDIAAPSEQKVVFYTELYNVLIQSNQNSDADNHYSDRNEEAHHPADDKQSATMRF